MCMLCVCSSAGGGQPEPSGSSKGIGDVAPTSAQIVICMTFALLATFICADPGGELRALAEEESVHTCFSFYSYKNIRITTT